MQINPINSRVSVNTKGLQYTSGVKPENGEEDKSQNLIKELDKMSMMNNINIGKKDYAWRNWKKELIKII